MSCTLIAIYSQNRGLEWCSGKSDTQTSHPQVLHHSQVFTSCTQYGSSVFFKKKKKVKICFSQDEEKSYLESWTESNLSPGHWLFNSYRNDHQSVIHRTCLCNLLHKKTQWLGFLTETALPGLTWASQARVLNAAIQYPAPTPSKKPHCWNGTGMVKSEGGWQHVTKSW